MTEAQRAELEATLKVLRKSGVTDVRIGEISLTISAPDDQRKESTHERYSEETQFLHTGFIPDI